MAYFPQFNGNFILTQVPYKSGLSFETVAVDVESGMRFSSARRGSGLVGYPQLPLGNFDINCPSITDAEVLQLMAFFDVQRGSWGRFSVLDPSGNLVQYSEDFTHWDLTVGPVTVGASAVDPYGQPKATVLTASGSGAQVSAVVGSFLGGMVGTLVCVSVWAMASAPGQSLSVGLVDDLTSTPRGQTYAISPAAWTRISYRDFLWNDGQFSMVVGGFGTWGAGQSVVLFGAQASPTKGESDYQRSPGNYGYHALCRFATDEFTVQAQGPNQNSLVLPCLELGGA